MAIEDILRKIESDGKQKIREILENAEKQKRQIIKKTEAEYQNRKQEATEEINKEVELKKNTEILTFRNELRKGMLSTKQELVDKFFADYKQQLLRLSKSEYQDLIVRLSAKSIKTGEEEIVISKTEKKLDKAFLKKLRKAVNVKRFAVKFAKEKRTFAGGVIIKSAKFEVNNTFDILLKEIREKYEIDVMNLLFG